LRALLAEKDKQSTKQMIELESENDQLRREINDLNKIIEVKESLINVISHKKA
jgi:cell division protein FtsB